MYIHDKIEEPEDIIEEHLDAFTMPAFNFRKMIENTAQDIIKRTWYAHIGITGQTISIFFGEPSDEWRIEIDLRELLEEDLVKHPPDYMHEAEPEQLMGMKALLTEMLVKVDEAIATTKLELPHWWEQYYEDLQEGEEE